MTDIEALRGLDRLKNNISDQPQSLDDLWLSQPALWQILGWEKSQLNLWLRCQPEIETIHDNTAADKSRDLSPCFLRKATNNAQDKELGSEIVTILKGFGKPMPLVQLKNKLPSGLLATEPMIKAAVNRHPSLALVGPMVKLQ